MLKTKEIILLLISLIALPLLSFVLTYLKFDFKSYIYNYIRISDLLIVLIVYTIIIVMIIYAKIKEVDEDIRKLDTEQKRLGEKLKIHEQLIDLKARIEVLEKGGKYGKN